MNVTTTALAGVVIVEPTVFGDSRGFFLESYHARRYAEAGLPAQFVQHNHSRSVPGTLRGLHYQLAHPQGKLVRCIRGAVFDVAADVRRGSPSFGQWVAVELSERNHRQLYIPPGFAHGFCVPAEPSEIEYLCTDFYDPADQRGVLWSDPTLAIAWPVATPILSDNDLRFGVLSDDRADLPVFSVERD